MVTEGVDEIPEGVVCVEAVLACDEFTGDLLAYAQEHGYCPTPSKGEVTPQAVQTYNCGSAWICGFNNGIRGRMHVSFGFSSTQGRSREPLHRPVNRGTDRPAHAGSVQSPRSADPRSCNCREIRQARPSPIQGRARVSCGLRNRSTSESQSAHLQLATMIAKRIQSACLRRRLLRVRLDT